MKPIYLQMLAGLTATMAIGAGTAFAQSQDTAGNPDNLLSIEDETDADWNDQAQTAGEWTYTKQQHESYAYYGVDRTNRVFIIRCDLRTKRIGLARFLSSEPSARFMIVRTESATQRVTAEPRSNIRPLVGTEFAPDDRLLDAMAITQGRFAIEVEGEAPLYMPAWAEVTRVIEDCR